MTKKYSLRLRGLSVPDGEMSLRDLVDDLLELECEVTKRLGARLRRTLPELQS
jgi:hypothetical protein